MKKIVFIFCLFIYTFNSKSQNLVPNGDFEYYTSCPTTISQTSLAFPWQDPTNATPDYYNGCASLSSFVSVPYQTDGTLVLYQPAHSGVGYVGLWATHNDFNNYREYVQVQFTNPMIAGECYSVFFYANLSNLLKYGSNNIGAYISITAITTTAPNVLNYTPQILLTGNPAIIDTINWVLVSGTYTAIGGENYITIGNFKDDLNTLVQLVDSTNSFNGCYYYVDDVSVTECDTSGTGINEQQHDYKISMYPNPGNGNITLNYHLKENEKGMLSIYDVTGKQIKQIVLNSKEVQLNLTENNLQAGIYYYSITVNTKIIKTDKLLIIK